MTDDRAPLRYQDFIEEVRGYGTLLTDQCADRIESLAALLRAATVERTQIDHRIVAQVDALTAERDDYADQISKLLPAINREAAKQRSRAEAAEAERDALIRDRDRWAAEAQVNTSPIVAGLTAENERRRQRIQNQTDQINALERSRRRLESLMAGADRRVEVVEEENAWLKAVLEDIADGCGETELAEIGRYAPAIARAAINHGKEDI
jgi:chromosome segregation ATPase